MNKKFFLCLKFLHYFPGKSGILKVQSGSNEETLMPRQSLRITRRLTCDTLRNPGKRTNDVQTAHFEPSDFLCQWPPYFYGGHFCLCSLVPICQIITFPHISAKVTEKRIQEESGIQISQKQHGFWRNPGEQYQKNQTDE